LRILGSIICRSVTSFTRKNDAFGLPKLKLTAASAYRYLRPVSSDEKHRNAVRTLRQIYCILNVSLPIHMMFPHFPVLPFPPLEFWSCVFRSCDFHPYDLVPRFPVPRFPFPRFQSPHFATDCYRATLCVSAVFAVARCLAVCLSRWCIPDG